MCIRMYVGCEWILWFQYDFTNSNMIADTLIYEHVLRIIERNHKIEQHKIEKIGAFMRINSKRSMTCTHANRIGWFEVNESGREKEREIQIEWRKKRIQANNECHFAIFIVLLIWFILLQVVCLTDAAALFSLSLSSRRNGCSINMLQNACTSSSTFMLKLFSYETQVKFISLTVLLLVLMLMLLLLLCHWNFSKSIRASRMR